MVVEPNFHTHIIGFPYYTNSNNTNHREDKNTEIANNNTSPTFIYEPLYELSSKYLENGYSVLYLAESAPNETIKAKIIENMVNINSNSNSTKATIQNNISKGMLTIIDSGAMYKDNASGIDIVDFLVSNVHEMQEKSQQQKIKGSMIFNSPDPFFSRNKYEVFMDFEAEITKKLPENVGLLCWYKTKWLSNLSLAHAIYLLASHKYTIHNDSKYKEWSISKIIDVITKGIDNNLGEGSSVLLFQTMKSAYKLNQDAIIHRPTVFEETLKQILGKDDANSVINSIFEEIIEEGEFSLV